ncbi:murein biosynthesis integral membrane protein MurJ [Lentibacillus cibarius]|uniref:Lipid II flippase n=1 Tax=Lentibacillus cibarius TaxID=2583219 RepID=A0A549YFG6_9BACI|nr:murein biosynthesis integral membrane protein MurJ [Lentibacillus cibarius]TRM10631.1 murein biosynthesis integral membrane protein MurJ [Lentibacillus cibarius]
MKRTFLKLLGTVALINVIARLLGFAREVIIGYQYGTGYEADSIITAFTIPNFIYIVVGGAITTAFISVYSKTADSNKHTFVQTVLTGLGIIIGVLTILFVFIPEFWMNLFFGGLSPEAMALTSNLFVLMAPATFFLALAMAFSGLHNVHNNFRLTAMSTLIFNAVFLIIGFGLTSIMSAYAYGLGALLGSFFMLVFLVTYIRKQAIMPFRIRLVPMPEITRFVKMALPIIFGGATIQFYFIIQRIYAADLSEGVIAAMNYASKMTQFPQAVLMTSVTTVIYPMLAKAVNDGDAQKLTKAYQQGFHMLCTLLLPATVFIFMYAKDIIAFIFEYGHFDAQSTNATYPLLQVFSFGIFALALNTYVTRFFYARENAYLPIGMNVLSVFGVNILVITLLIDDLGAQAIALGTVVASIVNMLLLLAAAKHKLGLVVSSWRGIGKLAGFVGGAAVLIYCTSLIPIDSHVWSLVFGGGVTGMLVLLGLKWSGGMKRG